VAHDGVRPRRDDALVLGHLDRRRGERVHAVHAPDEIEAQHEQRVTEERERRGHVRPAVTPVERGDDQQRDEADRGEEHDDLLPRLLFRGGPTFQPALQERRVPAGQVERDDEGGPEEGTEE